MPRVDSQNRIQNKNFKRAFLLFFVLIFIALLYYFGRGVWIKNQGFKAQVTSETNLMVAVGKDLFKVRPNCTAGKYGDAEACIAFNLKRLKLYNDQWIRDSFCLALNNSKVLSNNSFRWKYINRAFKGVNEYHKKNFDSEALIKELEQGNTPIIWAGTEANKQWYILLGAEEGHFVVLNVNDTNSKELPIEQLPNSNYIYAYHSLYIDSVARFQ
ncbi:MAG: hypothetical protein SGJ04_01850 [Bacteroidota bacterium]|nr:hypothetical protein [Bacteroidota bacterium]